MIRTIVTARLAIWVSLGLLLWVMFWLAARRYNKDGSKHLKLDLFRVPTGNVLTILGLLIPVLVGLLAYLFERMPTAHFSFLVASIFFCLVTLIVAVWETFALISVPSSGSDKDMVTLTFPKHRYLVTALGVMYSSLLLGIVYLCCFLLFELTSIGSQQHDASATSTGPFVQRTRLAIGASQTDVTDAWGRPATSDARAGAWAYETAGSTVRLFFGPTGRLREIRETERGANGSK